MSDKKTITGIFFLATMGVDTVLLTLKSGRDDHKNDYSMIFNVANKPECNAQPADGGTAECHIKTDKGLKYFYDKETANLLQASFGKDVMCNVTSVDVLEKCQPIMTLRAVH